MPVDQDELTDLRKERTKAFRALKKASVALSNALQHKQTVTDVVIKDLERAWNSYSFMHAEFSEFLTKNKLEPNSTEATVNDLGLNEYHALAKNYYANFEDSVKEIVEKKPDVSPPVATAGGDTPSSDHSFLASLLKDSVNPDTLYRSGYAKQEYPTWDGKPGKSWMEWRALWEQEVVPLFRTRKLNLALLLRKCVKGEGAKEIEHVPLSDSDCYDVMWRALVDRFDNTALNVRVVINNFSSFKPVRENDRKALLDFIRDVKSAHSQLSVLKQVSQVDVIAVTQLSSLLPNSMQESWAVIYASLDASGKYHPFEKFVDFLKAKEDMVRALVELSYTAQSGAGNSSTNSRSQTRGAKPATRAYATSSHSTSHACSLHPEGTHDLIDCRAFQKMSASERSDVCTEHGLCKRCFASKHTGQRCDGDYSCKYCKDPKAANSHNELLCFRKHGYPEGNGIKKPYGGAQSKQFNAPKNHAVSAEGKSLPSNFGSNQMPQSAVGPQIQANQAYTMPHPFVIHPMGMGGATNPQQASQVMANPYTAYTFPNFYPWQILPPINLPGQLLVQGGNTNSNLVMNNSGENVNNTSINGISPGSGTAQGENGTSSSTLPLGSPDPKSQFVNGAGTQVPQVRRYPSSDNRHISMSAQIFNIVTDSNQVNREHESDALKEHVFGIYAIYGVQAAHAREPAIIFCDDGSDCSMVSEKGLEKLNGKVLSCGWMDMTTLHGTKSVPTKLCEISIIDPSGKPHVLICYTVPTLCGKPFQLDESMLRRLFPQIPVSEIQRPTAEVDILLGADYFRLHPKHELATDGANLSVMEGPLGKCVQGAHRTVIAGSNTNPYAGYRLSYRGSYACSVSSFRFDIPVHPRLGQHSYGAAPASLTSPAGDDENIEPIEATPFCVAVSSCTEDPMENPIRTHPAEATLEVSTVGLVDDTLKSAISHPVSLAAARGNFGEALDKYILGEDLGTACVPRCGGCRCGKCPLPGHDFSFKEEQELALIQSKLRYLKDKCCWITGYPWIIDPGSLPDNYPAAYSTLCRTERTLAKDPEWRATYQRQIDDHRDRGVARLLSAEEVRRWQGPYLYLSHMALEQPKSESTPVRIVFNSSQKYKGLSLNDCLAKGPDCYNNNLLGMLIRFRENPTVLIGDIKKMYNSVLLEEMEMHMHRFLWRECDSSRPPDIWAITRVNLGDKPSGTIAITAKNNTAHMFSHIDEDAARMLIYSVYTDDIIDSIAGGFPRALELARNAEKILGKGGFSVKGWTFAGKDVPADHIEKDFQQVLGVFFHAVKDVIFFPVKLNFSPLRRKVPTGPDLTIEDVPRGIPAALTRRIVLSQSLRSLYDPNGLVSPVTLMSKILLRETWQSEHGWDDLLSPDLVHKWRSYFISLFEVAHITFPRCLTPEDACGSPQLVILSDGSETAYGCAAYIRWERSSGDFWCRLIMAKSRIAPLNRVNIPQMELNGAVLSKRIREVIQEESRFEFEKVHHLIDSETVLRQLQKVAHRFRVYEGVRIGEIQSATGGNMEEWAWISGKVNVADLTTRPQLPSAIGEGSEWINGPQFLYLPEAEWPVKRSSHGNEELLPGEKLFIHCSSLCMVACYCVKFCVFHNKVHKKDYLAQSLKNCSRVSVAVGGIARVKSIFKKKSFKGGRSEFITPKLRHLVLRMMIEEAQCCTWSTEKEVSQLFRHINVELYDKLWVAASRDPRVKRKSPLSPDHRPQVLLPPDHILTRRIMREAHESGRHAGRDATLALFRAKYHTAKASRLATTICRECALCKLLKVKLLKQKMGPLPEERFSPSLPFDSCMLDLFGPYLIQGEVNKRSSGKVWGVLLVDLVSRAVHIEVSSGYDTRSFLVAFRRFAAVRGYPSIIYSDPGTQLVGAHHELKIAYESLQKNEVIEVLSQKGTKWIFGPADSPWYQGAAEALIKSAKFALSISVRNVRLSFAELLTAFSEAANLLNERPIGLMPSTDNPANILTPNNLLLGRSTAVNPGGVDPSISLFSRATTINQVVDEFWHQWTQLYAPTLLKQSKWSHEARPLRVGDVVLVADNNVLKGEYRLAVVESVHPSRDGVIRRVSVRYTVYKSVGKEVQLKGGRSIVVDRSIQRLSLIVPVDEQGE